MGVVMWGGAREGLWGREGRYFSLDLYYAVWGDVGSDAWLAEEVGCGYC